MTVNPRPKTARLVFLTLLVSACAHADGMAGDYKGTYSSNGGGGGNLRMSIRKTAGAWDCKFAFTVGNQPEINARHVVCAADGNRLKGHYEVASDGGTSKITLEAAKSGKSLEGTYTELGPDGKPADSGRWKVSLAH